VKLRRPLLGNLVLLRQRERSEEVRFDERKLIGGERGGGGARDVELELVPSFSGEVAAADLFWS
jgi:hypothetical protein